MAFQFPALKTRSKITFGICSPMVLLLIIGSTGIINLNAVVETDKWVEHTHKVLEQAAEISNSALDMETGMRGYLLAGKT